MPRSHWTRILESGRTHRRPVYHQRSPRFDSLERRTLLSGEPTVVGVSQLTDSTPDQLRIAVDFSDAMDPATAQSPANYFVCRGDGPGLQVTSISYADAGSTHRASLTARGTGVLPGGTYDVRVDRSHLLEHGRRGDDCGEGRIIGLPVGQQPLHHGSECDWTVRRTGPAPEPRLQDPPRTIVSADFNGDGFPDLATISPSDTGIGGANPVQGQMLIFFGSAGGTYGAPQVIDLPQNQTASQLRLVDWDRNGTMDLAVGSCIAGTADARVYIFLTDTTGHFTPAPETPIPLPNLGSYSLQSIAFGNFLGDPSPRDHRAP